MAAYVFSVFGLCSLGIASFIDMYSSCHACHCVRIIMTCYAQPYYGVPLTITEDVVCVQIESGYIHTYYSTHYWAKL